MTDLLREIDERLSTLLQRLQRGDDAPPAMRLRLEGLLEAAVIVGDATPASLQQRIDTLHHETCGASLSSSLGDNWAGDHPFPEIPLFAARAPVSPTTAD